jgi:pimeloyl-ACP methyl ester carboxylesterase
MQALNWGPLRRTASGSVSNLGATLIASAAFALGMNRLCAATEPPPQRLELTPCHVPEVQEQLRCGVYPVFENRQAGQGRKLQLKVIVLPARGTAAKEAPIFYLAGGPGETNTDFAKVYSSSTLRQGHDIVLVDSRGTGDSHRLACRSSRSDDDLASYLQSPFAPEVAKVCRRELEARADLSQYSTAAMVDDFDDVRRALGFDQINLDGGSFGTYAALMYIRAHPEHVRSAYLTSLVPLEARVPLYLSQAAQWALDQLFSACASDAACRASYPTLRQDFSAILDRLRQGSVSAKVHHPVTGAITEVDLTEQAFADAVRTTMYSGERGRTVPFLIEQARAGNFDLLAQIVIDASRDFYAGAPMGLYYSVTCNEFVDRIRPEEIDAATRGTYAGSWRVTAQMASCKEWPKPILPKDYFSAPIRSDVAVLLVSGDTDPASPPQWGELVHSFFPNSVHLIVPGGHVPDSTCTDSIALAMFRAGTIQGLDLRCSAALRAAPFKLLSEAPAPRLLEGSR